MFQAVLCGPLHVGCDLETELRALSVVACEQIVRRVNSAHIQQGSAPAQGAQGSTSTSTTSGTTSGTVATPVTDAPTMLTAAELDTWLWGVLAKQEDMRGAVRHYVPGTVFY